MIPPCCGYSIDKIAQLLILKGEPNAVDLFDRHGVTLWVDGICQSHIPSETKMTKYGPIFCQGGLHGIHRNGYFDTK